MDVMNFVAGGAALGLIACFWGKIKTALWKGANFFVQQVEISSESAHEAVIAYLVAHFARSRLYDRMYGASHEHHRDGRYGLVPYEIFGNRTVVFWKSWTPFLFSNEQDRKAKTRTGNVAENSDSNAIKIYSTLTFLRGSLDVESILRSACERTNELSWSVSTAEEQTKNRFVIRYVPVRGKEDDDRSSSNGLAWYQQHFYQRRRLALKGKVLGRNLLAEISTVFTPTPSCAGTTP